MKTMQTDDLDLRCCDCMELMDEYPDNWFDLAIVDPPYGIGDKFKGGKSGKMQFNEVVDKGWDVAPDAEYFKELMRVSKNQIIWGGNYFDLPPTRCFIVWDKIVSENYSKSMCEYGWTSFDSKAMLAKVEWNGFLGAEDSRIHPTQKPVKLYDWLLSKYAEKGQKILDTHMGSGSIAIACHYAQCHLTASELDEDYFNAACERIERETRQQTLFT